MYVYCNHNERNNLISRETIFDYDWITKRRITWNDLVMKEKCSNFRHCENYHGILGIYSMYATLPAKLQRKHRKKRFPTVSSKWNRWIAAFYWRLLARANCIERQWKERQRYSPMEQGFSARRKKAGEGNRWIGRFHRKPFSFFSRVITRRFSSLNQIRTVISNWRTLIIRMILIDFSRRENILTISTVDQFAGTRGSFTSQIWSIARKR